MARLFEGNFPYVNQHGANFDWIIKALKELDVKTDELEESLSELTTLVNTINTNVTNITNTVNNLGGRVTALETSTSGLAGRVTALENADVTIIGRIEVIESELADIDLQELSDLINSVNVNSINRDNALSARISRLESATIHDVYNYYSDGNQLLFGSDLRHLPSACKTDDGYPLYWGNTKNRAENQTKTRAWKFTDTGMIPNTDSTDGYDYYQVGMFSSGLLLGNYTVTFAVSTGGDATPTWYTHTFQAENESWTIATGCVIRARSFYQWSGADTFYKTISFMGTPASWATFLGANKYIVYIYIENGNGSVDTSVTAKPKFCMKDRFAFEDVGSVTPVIPSPTEYNILTTPNITLKVTVGSTVHEYSGQIKANFYLWSFNGMLNGYCRVMIESSQSIRQYFALYPTEFEVDIDIRGNNLTRAKHLVQMSDSNNIKGYRATLNLENGAGGTDPIETAHLTWLATPIDLTEIVGENTYLLANIPVMNLIYT